MMKMNRFSYFTVPEVCVVPSASACATSNMNGQNRRELFVDQHLVSSPPPKKQLNPEMAFAFLRRDVKVFKHMFWSTFKIQLFFVFLAVLELEVDPHPLPQSSHFPKMTLPPEFTFVAHQAFPFSESTVVHSKYFFPLYLNGKMQFLLRTVLQTSHPS